MLNNQITTYTYGGRNQNLEKSNLLLRTRKKQNEAKSSFIMKQQARLQSRVKTNYTPHM